jgi:hypothetical protein
MAIKGGNAMSAFIVDPDTMNAVVNTIAHEQNEIGVSQAVRDVLTAFGLNGQPTDADTLDALGNEIYALNRDAVWQRYPNDPTPEDLPGPIPSPLGNFRYSPRKPDRMGGYKALRCLIYQCSEGDVPEREQFKALDALCDALAHRIVSDMDAYRERAWDA